MEQADSAYEAAEIAAGTPGLPRRLLLATDFSSRCDRALDRAVGLARQWDAELIAVHALEQSPAFAAAQERRKRFWHTRQDRARVMARQLRADILDDGVEAVVVVEEGDPADVVIRAAEERDASLIIAGHARAEPFGRLLLGATVERLARQAVAPVLVVRNRVRGPYRRVVVASDFSPASAQALTTAASLFGDAQLALLHVYQAPFSGLTSAEDADGAWARMAREEAEGFVAGVALPDAIRPSLNLLVEPGRPEAVLCDYVTQQDVDLVVVGRRGRSAVVDLLLGSTAHALMDILPCDVMLVTGSAAAAPAGERKFVG
jgi:nucleotide-binding universal stress UspA family protein